MLLTAQELRELAVEIRKVAARYSDPEENERGYRDGLRHAAGMLDNRAKELEDKADGAHEVGAVPPAA